MTMDEYLAEAARYSNLAREAETSLASMPVEYYRERSNECLREAFRKDK